MKILTLALTFAFALNAHAGYEKTRWGTPLDKVKRFYPNGYVSKSQNGEFKYGVIRTVAGYSLGYVNFKFSAKKLLESVTILFPDQSSTVRLKSEAYTPMKKYDCDQAAASIKKGLLQKYGKPATDSTLEKTIWRSGVTDIISFTSQPGPGGDLEHCTPTVYYGDEHVAKKVTDGL